MTAATRDLSDHLIDQIALLDLSPREAALAEEFVGNVNDEGYLVCPVAEIVDGINSEVSKAAEVAGDDSGEELPLYTIAEGEAMLARIQDLEPAGVGARDLRECLLLQLRQAGLDQSVPYRLVRDCFDELINHRWSEISKRFGISQTDVQRAADEIAKLDPKPGLIYSNASDNYITPDLVVDKIDGQYHVFLNDANLPRLKLSRAYQEIARDKKKFDGENKEFISNKLNSANWMIQAIEQRRQTMLKVMNYIVDRQREFFEKGVQFLKPLTLREVAEVINMHESTVSRVTNEKFVQPPRGVLPLKYFFSSGLSTTGGEDRHPARGIKDADSEAGRGRRPEAATHGPGDREHPQGRRRADSEADGRQVPRPARRIVGPYAEARVARRCPPAPRNHRQQQPPAGRSKRMSASHPACHFPSAPPAAPACWTSACSCQPRIEAANLPALLEPDGDGIPGVGRHVRGHRDRRRLGRWVVGRPRTARAGVSVSGQGSPPAVPRHLRCAPHGIPRLTRPRARLLSRRPAIQAERTCRPSSRRSSSGWVDMVDRHEEGEIRKGVRVERVQLAQPAAVQCPGARSQRREGLPPGGHGGAADPSGLASLHDRGRGRRGLQRRRGADPAVSSKRRHPSSSIAPGSSSGCSTCCPSGSSCDSAASRCCSSVASVERCSRSGSSPASSRSRSASSRPTLASARCSISWRRA